MVSKEELAFLGIKIPKALKKRIMAISHTRRMNEQSGASMSAVALEALSRGMEKIEAKEIANNMGS